MGRYGEIWGDMGRYGMIWEDMGRYGEIWGDGERHSRLEIWGDMGRYGEIWGDMGGETWGNMGRYPMGAGWGAMEGERDVGGSGRDEAGCGKMEVREGRDGAR